MEVVDHAALPVGDGGDDRRRLLRRGGVPGLQEGGGHGALHAVQSRLGGFGVGCLQPGLLALRALDDTLDVVASRLPEFL